MKMKDGGTINNSSSTDDYKNIKEQKNVKNKKDKKNIKNKNKRKIIKTKKQKNHKNKKDKKVNHEMISCITIKSSSFIDAVYNKISAKYTKRRSELGRLATILLKVIESSKIINEDWIRDFVNMKYNHQIVTLIKLNGIDMKLSLSVNLLFSHSVYQTLIGDDNLFWLIDNTLCPLNELVSGDSMYNELMHERDSKPFRVKKAHTEGLKTNVWFSDVWESLIRFDRGMAGEFIRLSNYMNDWTNDKATACVLSSIVVERFINRPMEMMVRAINDYEGSKLLNVIIKSLGLNSLDMGSCFCELASLQGMPEVLIDMRKKCEDRCDKKLSVDTIRIDENRLREVIVEILRDELDFKKYDPIYSDEKWLSRWLWTTNGGHSNMLSRLNEDWKLTIDERMYRKSAMENVSENMLNKWKGKSIVSGSVKPEIGKPGRPLLAVDTHTYACFEELLAPIEKAWKNKSVLLNPGGKGTYDICSRMLEIMSGINIMLDFDAFDTQQKLEHHKIVLDVVCNYVQFDVIKSEKLIKSIDNQMIYYQGEKVGLARYSLMTGHRATSFFNSILNRCYVQIAFGDGWNRIKSMHTGDDVFAATDDPKVFDDFFDNLDRFNIKMNPQKQSIGSVSGEFLRIAVNRESATGYVMRSIGRLISGNWEVSEILDPSRSLMNWVSMSRTILNRGRSSRVIQMLIRSMSRSTRLTQQECHDIMMGEWAIEGGPLFGKRPAWKGYKVLRFLSEGVDVKTKRVVLRGDYKSYATDDYLSNCLTEIEKDTLIELKTSVKEDMLTASYAKNEHVRSQIISDLDVELRRLPVMAINKVMSLRQILYYKHNRNFGVLLKYPILVMLKDKIDDKMLRHILKRLDYDTSGRLEEIAWGESTFGNVIQCPMSYADAASVCGIVDRAVIYHHYPMYC
jgi:hypothetical protein